MKTTFALCFVSLICPAPLALADARDIDLRRLFEPTPAELQQERAGRIYIYEGLTNREIERAMDQAFDRVESMMFIRKPITDEKGELVKDPETGKPQYEDDGC
jgi:hypothetical protein